MEHTISHTPQQLLSPHDADLEAIILGSCLLESSAILRVADKLRPEMFYNDPYRELFATLLSMHQAGKSIDLITVKNELSARGKLQAVGGPYGLTSLNARVISSAHLEEHALIMHQLYLRREMIHALQVLLSAAADESIDLDDTLVQLHQLVNHLEGETLVNNHLRNMDQLMMDTLQQVNQRVANNQNGITGIPTGLTRLDQLTAGWQPGDLHIIAARPSIGKTAFALHLALSAGRAGKHVIVYSLEMQGERLGDRWLCAQADNLNAKNLRTGQLCTQELQQIQEAAQELARLPIQVDDSPKMSMDHIRSAARLQQSKQRCDLLIIDYLQLCEMKTDQKNRNREQEVAEASRKAKLLAKEMNVPVLLLCQLNRECEQRGDKRPTLSDLRESGAIEQDADLVMLLYRPAFYDLPTDRKTNLPSEGLGIVIVAKNRNGETGEIPFSHNKSLTKIGNYKAIDF